MKAEEKFKALDSILRSDARGMFLAPHMCAEISELFNAWDSHQWQPIETAPRDQSDMLLWESGKIHTAFWYGQGSLDRCGFYDSETEEILIRGATHWMPLPQAALEGKQ